MLNGYSFNSIMYPIKNTIVPIIPGTVKKNGPFSCWILTISVKYMLLDSTTGMNKDKYNGNDPNTINLIERFELKSSKKLTFVSGLFDPIALSSNGMFPDITDFESAPIKT